MREAISLRRKLEPWFASLPDTVIDELGIALRVDGSLGSYGPPGVENITVDGARVECDLVIADHDWAKTGDAEIHALLHGQVADAVAACFNEAGIAFDRDTFPKLGAH